MLDTEFWESLIISVTNVLCELYYNVINFSQ